VSKVQDAKRKVNETIASTNPDRHYVFVIAAMLVGSFVVFYGITMYSEGARNEYKGIEKITTSMSPLIGAIIGFYFGNRPVQQLGKQAAEQATEKEQLQREVTDLYQQLAATNRLLAKKNDVSTKTRKIVDMVDEAIES
jgi:hypothetical protein